MGLLPIPSPRFTQGAAGPGLIRKYSEIFENSLPNELETLPRRNAATHSAIPCQWKG
jgi:hypothetical protein